MPQVAAKNTYALRSQGIKYIHIVLHESMSKY
jgi:hypothetical protein